MNIRLTLELQRLNRVKIGIVCYPTYGGSGVIATELGLGLAAKGHEVHFITYRMPVRLSGFQQNIYYHEVSPIDYALFDFSPYESSLASKMVDVVQKEKLDLLHVHYAVPHTTAAYLAKKILLEKGIYTPIITTLHGTDITLVGIDPSIAPVIEFCIQKSDGVTCVSQDLKNDTLKHFDITREIEVIHNFIDFSRFGPSNKEHFRQLIAPDGEKILIHISNFRKVKRICDIVDVFEIVNRELPSKLLLIGDGPERAAMESKINEKGLAADTRFLGKQDAVEELLAIADIFLLTSEKESFGLVALEAMACGVPVISSNAGGIGEVNIHGETGFLSEIGDYEDMAVNALRLLQDDVLLSQFRKNALERAQVFELSKILVQYEDMYERILAKAKHIIPAVN